MRKWLTSLIAAAALAVSASAQQNWKPVPVQAWGGIDSFHDSAAIADSDAQDAQNVFTDAGYLEKRTGSVLAATCASGVENFAEYIKTSGARVLVAHCGDNLYVTDFGAAPVLMASMTASTNVDFTVAFNKIIAVDGTREVEYDGTSTTTASGFPGCKFVDFGQNRIWCANIAAESTSLVRVSSYGTSGYWTIPADVATSASAPNSFYISYNDGQPITCMKNTPWGMVVGKRRSLWIVKGLDNLTWYIRNVDPVTGCADDRTMQMLDGNLVWQGVDGVYSWPGSGPPVLRSLDIDPTVKRTRQSTSQGESWAVDSQSDFLAGSFDWTNATQKAGSVIGTSVTFVTDSTAAFAVGTLVNISTSSTEVVFGSVRSIMLSSTVFQDNFADGDYTASPTWTVTAGAFSVSSSWLYGTSGGAVSMANSIYSDFVNTSSRSWTFSTYYTNTRTSGDRNFCYNPQAGGEGECWQFRFADDGGSNYLELRLYSQVGAATAYLRKYSGGGYTTLTSASLTYNAYTAYDWRVVSSTGGVYYVYLDGSLLLTGYSTPLGGTRVTYVASANPNSGYYSIFNEITNIYSYAYKSSGSWTSQIFDTALTTPTWGNFVADLSSTSVMPIAFQVQASTDADDTFEALVSQTNGSQVSAKKGRYVRAVASFQTELSTQTPYLRSVSIPAATTGYYYSAVHFVGADVSSWTAFDVGQTVPNSSTITYQVREATYSFSALGTSPAWVAQTANQSVNLAVSTPTYLQWRAYLNFDNADLAPSVDLVRANWDTGLAVSPAASAVLDHRYFLCVAIDAATNDTCLVWQKNRKWTTMVGHNYGAMVLYNNDILTGDSATGKIYKELQSGLYSDDGAAIDAYWKTKDFTDGIVFNNKVLHEIWLDAVPYSASSMTVSYAVDKSTSWVDTTVSLDTGKNYVNKWVPLTAGYAVGKYFRFKFADNNVNSFQRLNAFLLYLEDRPRTVP